MAHRPSIARPGKGSDSLKVPSFFVHFFIFCSGRRKEENKLFALAVFPVLLISLQTKMALGTLARAAAARLLASQQQVASSSSMTTSSMTSTAAAALASASRRAFSASAAAASDEPLIEHEVRSSRHRAM
jgi:hypothetical protein